MVEYIKQDLGLIITIHLSPPFHTMILDTLHQLVRSTKPKLLALLHHVVPMMNLVLRHYIGSYIIIEDEQSCYDMGRQIKVITIPHALQY